MRSIKKGSTRQHITKIDFLRSADDFDSYISTRQHILLIMTICRNYLPNDISTLRSMLSILNFRAEEDIAKAMAKRRRKKERKKERRIDYHIRWCCTFDFTPVRTERDKSQFTLVRTKLQ